MKNNGVHPICEDKKIALFGAHADDLYYQLGDYTSLRKSEEGETIRQVLEK